MHTAVQLDTGLFEVMIDGSPAAPLDALPGWGRLDRFGVVVDRLYGGVGASLLLQLAVAAFYECDAGRPGRAYPEVYVFHVGGWHGTFGWYDVFPPRKEVLVDDDPAAILDAINDRGITRLAVVDGPVEAVRLHSQEPGAALDRIVSAYAYHPRGRASNGDLEIAALDPRALQNTLVTLVPEHHEQLWDELAALAAPVKEDEELVLPNMELAPLEQREAILRGRDALCRDGLPVERYRRIAVAEALGMLHVRSAG